MIAFRYVTNQVWAIREDYLKLIVDVTTRETNIKEVEAQLGKKLENRSRTASISELPEEVGGTVAVVPVIGPIVRYADMFSQVSGLTALEGVKSSFISALEDDSVSAILFDIDSPGGEANGINEFAELVYNSRGKKPMISYVSNMACSAAYWIASATDKIICDETATLGSIGCAAVMVDSEERDAMNGIKRIEFVSSNSPNKRPDISTDKGRALIQEQIDTIGDIFIGKVARNRSTEDNKLSDKDVIKNFNKGGVLIGNDAVKAGLADSLGSLESVLKNLGQEIVLSAQYNKETSMKLENEDIKVDSENEETSVTAEETSVEETVENTTVEEGNEVLDTTEETLVEEVAEEAVVAETSAPTTGNEDLLARLKALEEANFKLEQENLTAKAEQIVAGLGNKIVPAQRKGLIAAYVHASNDDKANPIKGFSRVNNLMQVWEAMPSHKLTEELMEDTVTDTLSNNIEGEDSEKALLNKLAEQAKAHAAKLNAKNKKVAKS